LNNFLGIEEQYSDYQSSKIVIIPAPFEQTTSYMGGTEQGPEAIIKASAYVELYDEETGNETYRVGVHTAESLCFSQNLEQDFAQITSAFRSALADGKFPVGLGGEHSITFPIYRAFHEKFADLSVLHLDAHSDLRESYEDSLYSHASVMRRIYEINPNIVQVGIRSQCIEEAEFIRQNKINTFYAHQVIAGGLGDYITDRLSSNVFISIDVDFFDPAIMPSTGTPEPGGFLWNETIAFLRDVFRRKNVVGFDVVELSPLPGVVHPDFMTAKLIYKLLGFKFAGVAG
jgi:agmatinase